MKSFCSTEQIQIRLIVFVNLVLIEAFVGLMVNKNFANLTNESEKYLGRKKRYLTAERMRKAVFCIIIQIFFANAF